MLMSSGENAATLLYGPNGFRVIRPGHFVLCAVTGERERSACRPKPHSLPVRRLAAISGLA